MRNGSQYSVDDIIKVELRHHCLQIENRVADAIGSATATDGVDMSEVDYGYGLGLFLANKICQQQRWQLDVTSTAQLFTVKVNFNSIEERPILG